MTAIPSPPPDPPPLPLHIIRDASGAASALDPLRQRLLEALAHPDSATGLARRLTLPRQQLNYHLRRLEAEGLIRVVGERRRRGCTERLYAPVASSYLISPAALGALAADPAKIRDQASSSYLLAAAARTIREVAALRAQAEEAGQRVPTLTLDGTIRFATATDQHAFAEELARAVAGVVAKYHDDQAKDGRRFRVTVAAHPELAMEMPPPGSEEESRHGA
jgi:DNA-binding transcriptional ArsR family regulator